MTDTQREARQALFDHMMQEHNVTLLDSEITDIVELCRPLIQLQAALAHSPKLPLRESEYIPVLDLLLRNGELADYDDELANRLQELKNYLEAITNRKDE